MIKLKNILESLSEHPLTESVFDKGLFKAVFFSGIPGAGKSYVINSITDGQIQPRIVNFDKYSEFLAKKYNLPDAGDQDFPFVDQAKTMTISQLSGYVNGLLPLFIDTTSNKANRTMLRDGVLKSFGYDTGLVWINTPLDVALDRIKQRDRSVSDDFVVSVHRSLEENIKYYKTQFSFFIEVKNGAGELTDEVIRDAYKTASSFFREDIQNPIGKRNYKKAFDTTGYLVPHVYKSISDIKVKLSNWY